MNDLSNPPAPDAVRRFHAILPPDLYSKDTHRGDPVTAVLASDYDSMARQVAGLRATIVALKNYTGHRIYCDAVGNIDNKPCSCGLASALAGDQP